MAEDEFGRPATTVGIDWEAENGNLLALKGLEIKYAIPTEYGESDVVIARAVIVDGPNAGTVVEEQYVFPKILQRSLKPLNRVIVGRLYQGEKKGKNNPPWLLRDPSDAEFAQAQQAWRASLTAAPEFAKPGASAQDSPY